MKLSVACLKSYVACLVSIVSTSVLADSLSQLPAPQPPAHYSNPGVPVRCAALGFAENGTIYGACRYTSGNCGRYCQPPTYSYIVIWSADGVTAVSGDLCATTNGALANRVVTTYIAPHSALDCSLVWNQPTIVVVDGYTAHYVSAANDGRELVNINDVSYLWTP
jgi:hypothetical protein